MYMYLNKWYLYVWLKMIPAMSIDGFLVLVEPLPSNCFAGMWRSWSVHPVEVGACATLFRALRCTNYFQRPSAKPSVLVQRMAWSMKRPKVAKETPRSFYFFLPFRTTGTSFLTKRSGTRKSRMAETPCYRVLGCKEARVARCTFCGTNVGRKGPLSA